MSKNLKAFSNDVEVPEIVQAKADAALDMIRKESGETMKNTNTTNKHGNYYDKKKVERRYLHFFKSQTAAAACVIVLAGAGITAAAAGFHLWSRGMQGTIQATPEEQQKLIDQGVAVADDGSSSDKTDSSLSRLAVTDAGITVVPNTVIVDDRNAYVAFSVKGYDLLNNAAPYFNSTNYYLESEIGHVDMSDTGEPESHLSWDASFTGDKNNLEYIVLASAPEGTNMLGQTLHIDLGSLGTTENDNGFVEDVNGNWDFSIPLPDVSSGKTIEVGKQIEGSDFAIKDINISPISIRLNYTSTEKHEVKEDDVDLGMPEFTGVVLKDGTQYTAITNGGSEGYTDESFTDGYEEMRFTRVIDPNEVAALLFYPTDGGGEDIVKVSLED